MVSQSASQQWEVDRERSVRVRKGPNKWHAKHGGDSVECVLAWLSLRCKDREKESPSGGGSMLTQRERGFLCAGSTKRQRDRGMLCAGPTESLLSAGQGTLSPAVICCLVHGGVYSGAVCWPY